MSSRQVGIAIAFFSSCILFVAFCTEKRECVARLVLSVANQAGYSCNSNIGIELHQEGIFVEGRCGAYYSQDEVRGIGLRNFAPCGNKSTLGEEPSWQHTLLEGGPNLEAFGRQAPKLLLDAQAVPLGVIDFTLTIPVYNTGKILLRTLPSVFQMTKGAWELIVVLDACYDASMDIVKEIVEHHFASSECLRVRVVEQPTAVWETSANNIAMRMSSPSKAYILSQGDVLISEEGWNQRMWEPFSREAPEKRVFAVSGRCCHDLNMTEGSSIGRCGRNVGEPLPEGYDRDTFEIRETCNRGPLMLHAARTQEMGLLDEANFVFENDEHDLMRRVHRYHGGPPDNWKVGYYPFGFHSPMDWSSRRIPFTFFTSYTPRKVAESEAMYFRKRQNHGQH